ncbi:septal ring lytic transglycosylase RlpA family protein [Fontimonas sp. SYSU GA230001]|uniref:septal ring lytic transglycosylase RlpA family protein n=1 Tax=Fontimonas sp. SYSU GA230001 TaxID=3142450 RepID=UPI0032B53449
MRRIGAPAAALVLALTLGACSSLPPPRGPSSEVPPLPPRNSMDPNAGRYALAKDEPPRPEDVPPAIEETPDAIPRAEPRSASGNAPVYEVFGKTYRVLDSAAGFRERGTASWYGKKFHGQKTASGEVYDMYQMTAAHKSLPLPSYVRVTRLDTGKSVVVRVNDRGPFHKGRVIDLSYAAAAKLDMLHHGSTQVEVVALDPLVPEPSRENWLQVGAYADPINAVILRETLAQQGHGGVQILLDETAGAVPLHRVVLGPFADLAAAEPLRSRLQAQGYTTTWMHQ